MGTAVTGATSSSAKAANLAIDMSARGANRSLAGSESALAPFVDLHRRDECHFNHTYAAANAGTEQIHKMHSIKITIRGPMIAC
ncbi:MAG: hypothetical protein WAO08_08925 [Hyphomicrobiaceae bacterium]